MGSEKKEKIKGRERERANCLRLCIYQPTSLNVCVCQPEEWKGARVSTEREEAFQANEANTHFISYRWEWQILVCCPVWSCLLLLCCCCHQLCKCVWMCPTFSSSSYFSLSASFPFLLHFLKEQFRFAVCTLSLSLRSPPTQLPTLPPLCGTQTRTFKEGKK